MTDGVVSVNGVARGAVRPSPMIQILAVLTAAYLGLASYYAASNAFATVNLTLYVTAGAVLVIVGLGSQVRWRFGGVLVLSLSMIAQLAWAGWALPEPQGENAELLVQARTLANWFVSNGEFAAAELHKSSSPSATALYAAAIALFGENAVLRVLAAALWTAQAWFVWRICEQVAELRSMSFVAALLFGLAPALVVFGGHLSMQAVFGFFALLSVWLLLSHRRRGLGLSAFLSGVSGAWAFLAHPSGLAFVAGLIAVLLVGLLWEKRWPGRWRMALALLASIGGFALGVAPQAALNYEIEGRFSIAPGPAIGVELAHGTDMTGDGVLGERAKLELPFDGVAEIELDDLPSGQVLGQPVPIRVQQAPARREADLLARAFAMDQISSDPKAFLIFAVTTKMQSLWTSADAVLQPTTSAQARGPNGDPFTDSVIASQAASVIDGVFLAVLVLSTLGAARLVLRGGAVRDPTRWVLIFVAVLCLAIAYVFLRAQPLAHLAFVPFLALLAPIAFAKLPRVMSVRAEARANAAAAAEREAERDKAFDLASIHKPKPVDPDVASRSPEERLAMVLKGMSKPPRPADETRGGGQASAGARPGNATSAGEEPARSGPGRPKIAPIQPPRKGRDASA